jgi:DNA topoisomerase-1
VESSFGHVRDLPERKLGVDTAHDFAPEYVIPAKAAKQVTKLKGLAAKAENVILATDEDREGEAISWHLEQILKPKKYQRITFHEITKGAIEKALENPRTIDLNLVDAQQARRILDRLVGYELSPFLWKKVARGLSAGRVQSVAVRLVVERERERLAFIKDEYWTIDAIFTRDTAEFNAKLNSIDGKTLDKLAIKSDADAKAIVDYLKDKKLVVAKIEKKQQKKNPPLPFTTSTLQQAGNNKLHFSAKQTMMLAQQLYEGVKLGDDSIGLITYMRTDSLNLSADFLTQTQQYIKTKFGDKYAPAAPIKYKTKSKGAQEAHEAIRPTVIDRDPESVRQYLDEKQYRFYKLIWSRTLACQMNPAIIDATAVDIVDETNKYSFRANGQTVAFDGFYRVYSETAENILPDLKEKDAVAVKEILPNQHFTEPKPRYTEATLVKVLEEYGIGRPSTYAPTIATIQDRGYIEKEDRALKPTEMAMLVNDILVEHFPQIVNYQFTAQMEKNLDAVEEGEKKWQPVIAEFYGPFKENLLKKTKELTKDDISTEKTDIVCEKCGENMIIRTGRYGRFLACSGYPKCKNTKQIPKPIDPNAPPSAENSVPAEKCPDCGHDLAEKRGRFGAFIGCSNYPACKYIKKQDQSTGVACPKCGAGDIVLRKSKKGRLFYACNQYPKCEFILWHRPTGEKCEKCGGLMVFVKNEEKRCSNGECETNSEEKETRNKKQDTNR